MLPSNGDSAFPWATPKSSVGNCSYTKRSQVREFDVNGLAKQRQEIFSTDSVGDNISDGVFRDACEKRRDVGTGYVTRPGFNSFEDGFDGGGYGSKGVFFSTLDPAEAVRVAEIWLQGLDTKQNVKDAR